MHTFCIKVFKHRLKYFALFPCLCWYNPVIKKIWPIDKKLVSDLESSMDVEEYLFLTVPLRNIEDKDTFKIFAQFRDEIWNVNLEMNGHNEGYRCEGNETIPAHKSRLAMTGDLWHPWRPEIFQTLSGY